MFEKGITYYFGIKAFDKIDQVSQLSNNATLYIEIEDPNALEREQEKSWVYVELKNFYMMKDGKSLTLSNHLGKVYTLSGYSESMVENWSMQIKQTINFP